MIYFVRHGETDFNKQGITQGQLDIPLNQTGIKQANVLCKNLADIKFDVIFCSPLARAKKTAEIINKNHNVDIVLDDRLMEFYAGKRQGTKFSNWDEKNKSEFLEEPEKYGAESYKEFFDRCVEIYEEVKLLNKDVLIVSHGGVYRNIYRYKNGITDFSQKFHTPENCEIITLD